MTVSRKAFELASQEAAPQRVWSRPLVQRIDAGSAETGSNVTTDIGVSFS